MMPFVPPSGLAILPLHEVVEMWMRMEPQGSRPVVVWAAALVTISTSRLEVDRGTSNRFVERIQTPTFPATFRATMRAMRLPPSHHSSAPAVTPTMDLTMLTRGRLYCLRLVSVHTSPHHAKLITLHLVAIGALATDKVGGLGDIATDDTMMTRTKSDAVVSQDPEMSVASTVLTVETVIAIVESRSTATIARTMSFLLRQHHRRSTADGQGRRTAFWREKRPG